MLAFNGAERLRVGIAFFGGDPDNFQFPRWCLDMSVLRIYENGKPAATPHHLPFNWAGASTGLLESMACGLPIVATDVGGVREYVGPDAGMLCPRRDPAALAAAILHVLDCPTRAAAMGAAARRRALGFDYRIVAGQLTDVYAASLDMAASEA